MRKPYSSSILAAFYLGFLSCPYVYIAIGALSQFSMAFSLIMLPILVLCTGLLFWQGLRLPRKHVAPLWLWAMQAVGVAFVLAFIVFISALGLQTGLERAGLSCLFALASALCWFPLVRWRGTLLEQSLQRLPLLLQKGFTVVCVGGSALMVAVDFFMAPRFI